MYGAPSGGYSGAPSRSDPSGMGMGGGGGGAYSSGGYGAASGGSYSNPPPAPAYLGGEFDFDVYPAGRGLHSSTIQLNVSRFCRKSTS
jgi:hypothetical protein